MFSVTKTGLNTLPLWTLKVSPTKSGVIIERRDHVLIGALDLMSLAFWILSRRWKSTNGPFLIERPIMQKFSSTNHDARRLFQFHRPAIAPDEDEAVRVL